jgi:hypothetical protein
MWGTSMEAASQSTMEAAPLACCLRQSGQRGTCCMSRRCIVGCATVILCTVNFAAMAASCRLLLHAQQAGNNVLHAINGPPLRQVTGFMTSLWQMKTWYYLRCKPCCDSCDGWILLDSPNLPTSNQRQVRQSAAWGAWHAPEFFESPHALGQRGNSVL